MISTRTIIKLTLCFFFTNTFVLSKIALEPVAPTLAGRYEPAMGYKGLCECYQTLVNIVNAHWSTEKSAKQLSTETSEQALESFFEGIQKSPHFTSLDTYLAQLECDIQVLNQLEQITLTLPSEVRKLSESMRSLRTVLSHIRTLINDHRFYHHGVNLLVMISSSFSKELSLLKSKELETLTAYIRTSSRDYLKELTMSTERIKAAILITQRPYPKISQELQTLLKNCEYFKNIYKKA